MQKQEQNSAQQSLKKTATLLRRAAYVCFAVGAGTLLYIVVILAPKLGALENRAEQSLATLADAGGTLRELNGVGNASLSSLRAGAHTLSTLPSSLAGVQKAAEQGSRVLGATAKTSKEVRGGLVGIVLPKDELRKDEAHLNQTANKVVELGQSLGDSAESSVNLSRATQTLAVELQKVEPVLSRLRTSLDEVGPRLGDLRGALRSAELSVQICLLVTLIAGLYFAAGALLLGLANHVGRE